MWVFKCSACHEEFVDASEVVAEAEFMKHAREVHNPTTLISIKIPETNKEGAA